MTLSSKTKFYVTFVVSLIIIFTIGFFGNIIPLKGIRDTKAKINEQREILGSFSNKEGYKRELMQEAEEVDYLGQSLEELLLSKDNVLDLIVDLEEIAKKTNNTHSISLIEQVVAKSSGEEVAGEEKEMEDQNKISFRVSTQASFKNLIIFLAYVENTRYYTEISSLTISGKKLEGGSDSFNANFTLSVYIK